MHKLESPANAPRALTVLTLESVGSSPSIILSTRDAGHFVGTVWTVQEDKRKQVVAFFAGDGSPVELVGNVDEDAAVEISGAQKVVLEVAVVSQLTVARSAGQVSRELSALQVVRIREVWSSRTNKLWSADLPAAVGGKVMDTAGRVS